MPCVCVSDFTMAEDRELVRDARAGNERALSELYARYDILIRTRGASFTSAGLETEDLIQEGMIGLFSAVRNYRAEEGASFRTYARLCIDRRILSALRSSVRQKHFPLNNFVSLDVEANAKAAALAHVVNPEDTIVCREKICAIRGTVEKYFSTSERRIFNMYMRGFSYAAMANAMDVSIKYIDNSLQRIRKKLLMSVTG